jgi:hypothetical protein
MKSKIVNLMTEAEMQTVAAAVRLLSIHGLMQIKIGKTLITAEENTPRFGPLTFAEVRKTGEFVWLWADSGITIRPDELKFRMTLTAPKKEKIAPQWMDEHIDEVASALGVTDELKKLEDEAK